MRTNVAKWIKRFIIVAWLCGVSFVGWFYYEATNDPFNDWWFDEKIWKAESNGSGHNNQRGKMAYDLKHRVLKPNMTRKQVLQILGTPDGGNDTTSLTYNLGSWSGFGMDEDIFVIEFDKSGRISGINWAQT